MLQLFLISITNLQEKLWLAFFKCVEKNCVVHLRHLRILIRHQVAFFAVCYLKTSGQKS